MKGLLPIRALPRVFVPGASPEDAIELPQEEIDKIRKVLRLSTGAEIGVLPNDGSLIRCRFEGRDATPLEQVWPSTESPLRLTVAQALPRGDKLDEIIRACTEIGVAQFVLFPSERTVVKWDAKKTGERIRRLETIAREACEMCFRTLLPTFRLFPDLKSVLKEYPSATVLSEVEGVSPKLSAQATQMTLVVGPEGGWASSELKQIGDRGVTLGPRVLRVDHAAAAAASILLLDHD